MASKIWLVVCDQFANYVSLQIGASTAACWMPENVTLTWYLASMASMASKITNFMFISRVWLFELMNSKKFFITNLH